MWFLITIALIIKWATSGEILYLIAAGLFAIATSVSVLVNDFYKKLSVVLETFLKNMNITNRH